MPSPFGINVLAQTVHDRTALLNWLAAAQPACTLVMDSHDLAQQVRKLLPAALTIHRAYHKDDAHWFDVVSPQEWLNAHMPFAANGVALQVLNEPVITDAALTWLEQLCAICPPDVRLALPNFAVGNPFEGDILAGKYDRLLRLVCGKQHILALHEYLIDDPYAERPYFCGRYTFWLRRARELNLPAPRICITEHGRDVGGGRHDGWQDTGWGEQGYFDRLEEAQYANYYADGVPVCIYCWGTGFNNDWLSFDIQHATTLQKLLVDWNKTHLMTGGTPLPPTPSTSLGLHTLTQLPATYVNVRNAPAQTGADVGDLRKGDLVTLYDPPSNGWVYIEKGALKGWTSLQNGAVVFTPVNVPTPTLRIKDPVCCASVITSRFGVPRDYDGDGVFDDIHEGLDLAPAHKDCTPLVRAGVDGVVVEVSNVGAYGNHVKVKTTVGTQAYVLWYCHLERILVVMNQTVKAADYVGVMGSTGNSTGMHLHLNCQKVGAPTPAGSPVPSVINPEPLIV